MKRPLFWVSVCFIVGAAVGQFPMKLWHLLLITGLCIGLWGTRKLFHRLSVPGCCILAVLTGIYLSFYYGILADEFQAKHLVKNQYRGTVTKVMEYGFEMRLEQTGFFTFYCTVYEEKTAVATGDAVCVYGQAESHSSGRNDGAFNADAYYASNGNLFEVTAEATERIRSAPLWRSLLDDVRTSLLRKITALYSENTEGFLEAIFLGTRQTLSDEQYSSYQIFGIAHILAISGMHISILGGILLAVIGIILPKGRAGAVVTLMLFCYGFLTGFSLSCLRAVGTFGIVYLGRMLRRTSDPYTTLAFLALVMTVRRPVIIHNIAFQMSFASGALMLMFRQLPLLRKQSRNRILSTLSTSLLMQMSLLPLQLYYFYQFSPYGVVVNLVVLLVLEEIFLVFLVSILFSYVWFPAGIFFSGVVEWSVRGLNQFCDVLSQMPGAEIVTGRPSVLQIFLYMILLLWIVLQIKKGNTNRMVLLIGLWMILLPLPFGEMAIYNLDVGQGDCSVILAGRQCIVIDCGSMSKEHVGEKCLIPFLKYHGHSEIDVFMISHEDSDHTNGVIDLTESGIPIRMFYLPVSSRESDFAEQITATYKTEFLMQGDTIQLFYRSDFFQNKSAFLEVYWPEAEYSEDTNKESMLFLMKCGAHKVLFAGDTDAEVLGLLAKDYAEAIAGLSYWKVAHHGSESALEEVFYQCTRPKCSVISVGNNSYGHPSEEVLKGLSKNGSHCLTTLEYGQITISFRGNRIIVHTKVAENECTHFIDNKPEN